jgi:transcriptional regulator with XRE-family HTH domain
METQRIHAQVAQNVKRLLAEKQMSAERLALEIGLSRGYIYEFLNGKKRASLETLRRIANGLDVKIKDLLPG